VVIRNQQSTVMIFLATEEVRALKMRANVMMDSTVYNVNLMNHETDMHLSPRHSLNGINDDNNNIRL